MKIINKKKEAIEELKRISTRTNSENNNKISRIVEEIIQIRRLKTKFNLFLSKLYMID